MTLYYLVRSLDAVPSCMYNIQMLHDTGYKVVVISGRSTSYLNSVMDRSGIEYYDGQSPKYSQKHLRFLNRFVLSRTYLKLVQKKLKDTGSEDLVILGTADSAISMYYRLGKYRYILVLKELYDNAFLYNIFLKRIAKKAVNVICCEENRARFHRFRWKLNKLPYTVSNKPYGYSFQKNMDGTTSHNQEVISTIRKHRHSIIYQARHIHFAYELIQLAKALKNINADIVLVLVGEVDNQQDIIRIRELYDKIICAGHIPAPLHLEITSNSTIGVAVYAEISLNNLFCAPNKTYEYASFGIPSLCNNIPGLIETIGLNQAGRCIHWDSTEEIASAIQDILNRYDLYSSNATRFFQTEDNTSVLKGIIQDSLSRN